MKKLVNLGLACAGLAFVTGCGGTSSGGPSSIVPQTAGPQSVAAHQMTDFEAGIASGVFAHSCDVAEPGSASCHAIIRTDSGVGRSPQGKVGTNALPSGYGPADLQGAYGLTKAAPTTKTVGIVDAYDDPNLESDLGVYRSTYGLSPCTTANGCFKKVNQSGVQGSYPKSNGGWAQETSLDVDMVSANCPSCKIIVVEANSSSFANLSAGVNTAANLHANAISNSYGGSESSGESTYRSNYDHPGIAVTASSGDSGYGAQSPASFGTVVATGGTSLKIAGGTRSSETVWSGAGSGCSAYEKQPSWQGAVLPLPPGCSNRVIADVAYDADPNTGVAVYDSFSYRGQSGFLVFGGTSVASPAIAAIYALAGNALGVTSGSAAYPAYYTYTHIAYGSDLFDVTSGTNGTCTLKYLCTGGTGYDGPTGLGTPIGLAAF